MDYIVRKLNEVDSERIIEHFCELESEDRRLRFGTAISNYAIRHYVEESFKDNGSVWFGIDDDSGKLLSTCHVAITDDFAELGCSVVSKYRGYGLAQSMFSRAVTYLRTKSIKTVFMHCLTENHVMRYIAQKNDMVVVTCSQDEVDTELNIKPPTPSTFVENAYMDNMAFYDMITKNSLRMFKLFSGGSSRRT